MSAAFGDREQLAAIARFSEKDLRVIGQRRRPHNQLGFACQLAFVRLYNRFPAQEPLEVDPNVLTFVALQLDLAQDHVLLYQQRQPTLSEHQQVIRTYLALRNFNESVKKVEAIAFELATGLEQTAALLSRLQEYLKDQGILEPARDTLQRIIQTRREAARTALYSHVAQAVSQSVQETLDHLLVTGHRSHTPLHWLKQPPGLPSPAALNTLAKKLDVIESTGALAIDMAWLNNNFQRNLARYARHCSAYRLRNLVSERRYAVLVCYLHQLYQDTFDALVHMYDKLINKVYNKADNDVDQFLKKQRRQIRTSLSHYRQILAILLNDTIDEGGLRTTLYECIDSATLLEEQVGIDAMLSSKQHDTFDRVVARHSYLRQFSPALIKHLNLQVETGNAVTDELLRAVQLLDQMNRDRRFKLPNDSPTHFLPKRLRCHVIDESGAVNKSAWECALLTVLRDQVKAGNVSVKHSKRFATLDTFFIPESQWQQRREAFFARAGLPANADQVSEYLRKRLNTAYDTFLEHLPHNPYVRVDGEDWGVSTDPGEKLDTGTNQRLEMLKSWLGDQIRTIKLPDLLIDVDNALGFSQCFMPATDQQKPDAQQVCEVLAAVMAHASEIGIYTMAQITEGIGYHRLKQISDWQLHEDNQRRALAMRVNAISQFDVTSTRGDGTTSSSDGQRFGLRRKVLSQSYSHAFNDFALEFYSFVADNYAPYYSLPHECTDRDAPFVLDGILYNESDLTIEEHYTDTHGFTDINFAAFAFLGKRFAPRIKGLHKYAIFRADAEKDYGPLTPLVNKKDRTLNREWISEQWD